MQTLQTSLLGVTLLVSVVTDLKWRRIPDWLTYPMGLVALVLRGWGEGAGSLEAGVISGLVGAITAALPFGLMALRGGMGWGDAKLMVAVGAALGFPWALAALLFIAFAGALQALALLAWRRRAEPIPYAVSIALGSLCTLWWRQTGMTFAT